MWNAPISSLPSLVTSLLGVRPVRHRTTPPDGPGARGPAILLLSAVMLAALSSSSALGQAKPDCTPDADGGYSCPNVPGPYPKPQCTLDSFNDSKGGTWKISCTNASSGGDFVWEYTAGGGKGVKEIGRCVYYGGQNKDGYIRLPFNPKQVFGYWHEVIDGKNKNRRTVHLFLKAANRGLEIRQARNKTTGKWQTPDTSRFYSSLALGYEDGNPASPPAKALYSARLRLYATINPLGGAYIRWGAYQGPSLPNPVLKPGDRVFIDALSPGDVVAHDPRYSLAPSTSGIEFTANDVVVLNTGDPLATLGVAVDGLYYATNIQGADAYFQDVYDGVQNMEDDIEDTPLYAATAGTIALTSSPPGPPAPGLSPAGTGAMLAVLAGSGLVFMWRRRREEQGAGM